MSGWAEPSGEIGRAVAGASEQMLAAYREAPRLVLEHHNLELAAVEGGYGRRQLFELIQNGADELLGGHGRIEVVLTEDALYCANQGTPLSVEGVRALQYSHLSAKKGTEIGRFGLGFKSVLGISRAPEIFSRTGSVRFDRDAAREAIEAALGAKVTKAPVLRIAKPLDPEEIRHHDPILSEMMAWASTVVRLRRDQGDSAWLHEHMKDFPGEFLLFSPHVAQLTLEDRTTDVRRVITLRDDDDDHLLGAGGVESRWRVFRTTHRPSDAARADAGRHADRETIPLAWAVPTNRRRRGEFWAFFPTLDTTTMSGILNAPWKLNEDRTRVIEGPFNEELLEAACALVIANLPELVADDDPGLVLDLLPGRGRELLGWADEVVTKTINSTVGQHPCIPDQRGRLREPAKVKVHPPGIPREALDAWSRSPGRPDDWAHPSIETRERRPRVEVFMSSVSSLHRPPKIWIETLVREATVETSAAALRAAATAVELSGGRFLESMRRSRMVLTEQGELRRPQDAVFLQAELPLEMDVEYVHPEVAAAASEALKVFDIRPVAPAELLEAMLAEETRGWQADRWDQFWEVVRRTNPADVTRLVEAAGMHAGLIQVRCAAGPYMPLSCGLLPGPVVRQLSGEDQAVLIDTTFHASELRTLQLLGAVQAPSHNGGETREPWFEEYHDRALERYLEELKASGAAPSRDHLRFSSRPFAGPLEPLRRLSESGKARHVSALLEVAQDLKPWMFGHSTQTRYPRKAFPNPVVWMILRSGRLETSLGLRRPSAAVGPALDRFADLMPVARIRPDAAAAIGLPQREEDVSPRIWSELLGRADEISDAATLGQGYAAAAAHGTGCPEELRCRVGQAFDRRAPSAVVVAVTDHHANVFAQTAQPFVRVRRADDEAALIKRWGLRAAADTLRTEVTHTPAGEEELLIDAYPLIRAHLDEDQRSLRLIPCGELRLETFTDVGRLTDERRVLSHGDAIYFRADLGGHALLGSVSRALGLALSDADIERILRSVDASRARELEERIREATDDAERLLLAIGAEVLRRRIPKALIEAVEEMSGPLDARGVAELALVVHGVRVLQEHADELERKGLDVPAQWAGRRRALACVAKLGFGPEFAGFESSAPAAVLEVEGKPQLGPLHGYQEDIVSEMRSLLRGGDGDRGLLSLPTGAGKTRITVEAIVGAMSDGELADPVLWIAQTEELCEQAVQTWSEIWRALGPTRRLTISRLWRHYEAVRAEGGHQVVVATIAKLSSGVFENRSYDWLSKAGCLVVDEAHSSIGTQYTGLLEWQGMGRSKARAPLIGLTATPFRNTSVEETKRLVARYGGRRLDQSALGGEDAYRRLQDMGILSRVEHMLLPGSDLSLSEEELKEVQEKRRLPPRALDALSEDVGRNRTLVDSMLAFDPSWPVLVFATSKQHAEILAALLAREGVSAAAITGETDKGARRHYIERFRSGDLRVLTNYQVLTAGFDAPKVRVVFVARPTYSPNLYQQMIGRGLRGPLNGGTETCLLVNVADNVLQFGERLAFHDFDYLWEPGAREASPA